MYNDWNGNGRQDSVDRAIDEKLSGRAGDDQNTPSGSHKGSTNYAFWGAILLLAAINDDLLDGSTFLFLIILGLLIAAIVHKLKS